MHVANAYPQFRALARATPYFTRHTFVSCCLQAGISLATIASWCGTSIKMISRTYGRMITRYEGEVPVELALQYRTAKVQVCRCFRQVQGALAPTCREGPRAQISTPREAWVGPQVDPQA